MEGTTCAVVALLHPGRNRLCDVISIHELMDMLMVGSTVDSHTQSYCIGNIPTTIYALPLTALECLTYLPDEHLRAKSAGRAVNPLLEEITNGHALVYILSQFVCHPTFLRTDHGRHNKRYTPRSIKVQSIVHTML